MRPRWVLFLVGLVACATAHPVQTAHREDVSADSFRAANALFREVYQDAKRRTLERLGPVVLIEGAKVVLVDGATRSEAPLLPPSYEDLKVVSHAPLALFIALYRAEDTPVDRKELAHRLQDRFARVRSRLGAARFASVLVARQERILSACLSMIDRVLRGDTIGPEALRAFSREMGPLVLANAADAARAELDALHAQVSRWRHALGETRFGALHVVISGAHMAREGEVAMQYFSRLLGEDREGNRIVFAEGLWEEPRALDLLATHLVDAAAGEAFFADASRMHRDVLADGAREYLPQLLPEAGPK